MRCCWIIRVPPVPLKHAAIDHVELCVEYYLTELDKIYSYINIFGTSKIVKLGNITVMIKTSFGTICLYCGNYENGTRQLTINIVIISE